VEYNKSLNERYPSVLLYGRWDDRDKRNIFSEIIKNPYSPIGINNEVPNLYNKTR
jgi:hypothetical protein